MRKICLLASVAIVAAVGIALGSHEKTDSDSDRSRGDTWQTWAAVSGVPHWDAYQQIHPLLQQASYRPTHKPKHRESIPLPRPRPTEAPPKPLPERLAHKNPLELLFGSF